MPCSVTPKIIVNTTESQTLGNKDPSSHSVVWSSLAVRKFSHQFDICLHLWFTHRLSYSSEPSRVNAVSLSHNSPLFICRQLLHLSQPSLGQIPSVLCIFSHMKQFCSSIHPLLLPHYFYCLYQSQFSTEIKPGWVCVCMSGWVDGWIDTNIHTFLHTCITLRNWLSRLWRLASPRYTKWADRLEVKVQLKSKSHLLQNSLLLGEFSLLFYTGLQLIR